MTPIRISNACDLLRAARGEIRGDRVRRLSARAETDGGAATLVLPPALLAWLGLPARGRRRVRYADGRRAELDWTGDVLLELHGRRLLCDILVDPARRVPLVGGAALEAMELIADPVSVQAPVALARLLGARRGAPAGIRGPLGILARPWGFLGLLPKGWRHGGHASGRRAPHRRRPVNDIDQTIERVESLYRSLTGREPPPGGVGIPPEKDPAQHVTEQVDRLLGALDLQAVARPGPAASPPLSVWESPTEVRICVELPGVTRESVQVAVHGDMLSVSASQPASEPGFQLRLRERPSSYRRTLVLPAGVGEQDVRAQLRDGVLEIRFTKREQSAANLRPIPIA